MFLHRTKEFNSLRGKKQNSEIVFLVTSLFVSKINISDTEQHWERIIPYVVETFPTEHTASTKHPMALYNRVMLGKNASALDTDVFYGFPFQ